MNFDEHFANHQSQMKKAWGVVLAFWVICLIGTLAFLSLIGYILFRIALTL